MSKVNLYGVLQMEDLSPDQQAVAELIGIDNYALLIENFGGTSIYIPKADAFLRVTRDEQIRQEYDGGNIKALALKHSLSEMQIRNILADTIRELRAKPLDGQLDMFTNSA